LFQAGGLYANAIQGTTAGDVQGLQVAPAEGAVGGFVFGNGDELEQLAFRRDDEDSALILVDGFKPCGAVDAAGDIQAALPVHLESVGTARGVPVEDQLPAFRIDGSVFLEVEAPDLARASLGIVIVVGD